MRVEVVEDLGFGAGHLFRDLARELILKLFERGIDLAGRLAAGEDVTDSLLEVEAILDRTEHLVAGAEHTREQLELVRQQLQDALFRDVSLVTEVHDDDVVLLPEAVHAADALLDALRVPRQVIVDEHRAELQVDTFRRRFSRDHDRALLAEVVHERLAAIDSRDARDQVAVLVCRQPRLVDRRLLRRRVRSVEKYDAFAATSVGQRAGDVLLRLGRVGEDDRLLCGAQLTQPLEAHIEGLAQLDRLLIDGDRTSQCRVLAEFIHFGAHALECLGIELRA